MAPIHTESIFRAGNRSRSRWAGARRHGALCCAVFALAFARSAHADDTSPKPDTSKTDATKADTTLGLDANMSLDPSAPQAGALPGGVTPAFGQKSFNASEWRFDFHGYLTAPLTVGINQRQQVAGQMTPAVQPGQSSTVLHSPPVVPDDLETFSHTGTIPTTYAQLNFSEGNGIVSANFSILARQTNVSEGFLEPAAQLGISDAFLAITPDLGRKVRLRILVGSFTSRYGATGEYDEGRYGTPLIARINGAGEMVTAHIALNSDYALLLEQGIQGQTNKAGSSVTPDVWNQFADPGEGSTFVNHWHAGLAYKSLATLGAHFIGSWTQDDRSTNPLAPDGTLNVLAGDLRLTMGRYGHFYAAVARAEATHARSISRVMSVLNTPGGPGLMDDYLGSENNGGDGSGALTIVGGQYDLSLARLVSYPVPYAGDGPDLVLSVFGLMTHVESKLSNAQAGTYYGDGVNKLKYGAEVTYAVLPWLAFSARYDQVAPDLSQGDYSFGVLSPRVIFHTGWIASDQVVLQYSHWFDGGLTMVRTGEPPTDSPATVPDSDTISLSANMWW